MPFSEYKTISNIPIYIIQGNLNHGRRDLRLLNKILDKSYEEKFIIVEIIDDGNGFSPEIFALLGEPYVRRSIDKEDKGLGLGLFISKNLLSKSFGDIKFLNHNPNGACVKIFLNKKELNIK